MRFTSRMNYLRVYSAIMAGFGVFGLLTQPEYNPSFDFGLSLILLGVAL